MNGGVIRWIWVSVALLAMGLLIVACGATPEPAAVEPTEPPPTPAVVEPTEAPATPAAVEPTQPPAEEALFPPERPSAVRGKAIFEANCVTCHGAAGDGSGLPGAANFTDVEFMRKKKPAEFFEAIRDGIEGTAMPAWGETLSQMDIWDVLYYEWTFATSSEEIVQGQELFAANCVTCHGEAGDGSGLPGAANFTDQAFMSNKASLEFFEAIRDGVEGTAMPSWRDQFSEDEIESLRPEKSPLRLKLEILLRGDVTSRVKASDILGFLERLEGLLLSEDADSALEALKKIEGLIPKEP